MEGGFAAAGKGEAGDGLAEIEADCALATLLLQVAALLLLEQSPVEEVWMFAAVLL